MFWMLKCLNLSGFCHLGLVLFMVLWQSSDTPFLSCFHVKTLVCVPCFVLERVVRIPALMSWVSVSCRGSDTRAPCSVSLCERAARVRSAARSLVHVCCVCVVLHAVRVFIGCVHSCYVLCCVARSLCFSLLSCLVWTRGLWVFSLAACSCPVLHMAGNLFCWPCACFSFVWAHGFCLSFLCAMCSHVNCLDPTHLVTWLLVNLPHLCLSHYPPHLLPL